MTMKKHITLLALVAALLLTAAPPARAQVFAKALTAITTSTNSAFIPTGGSQNTEVYVMSASTSTSSIPVQACATAVAATCYAVATISNVAAAGVKLAGPSAPYLYFPATVSAGTVTVYYSTNNSTRLATWNDVKTPVASGAGTLNLTTLTASSTVTAATVAATSGITAGTTIAATGAITSGSTIAATAGLSGTTGTFTDVLSGTSISLSAGIAGTTGTFSSLTATYVPFAGAAGILSGYSGFTYAGATTSGVLTAPHLKDNSLTTTWVPFQGATGFLGIAGFAYTTATGALAVTQGTAPSVSTNRFLSTGSAPTTDGGSSTCGTTAPTIVGRDQAGIITVGSVSGTVCHVNFNVAFANAPACTVNGSAATNLKTSASTTILTITGTLTAAETISYHCFSY
jgi:hypothetical protein